MDDMTWKPEEKDEKVNEYLEEVNTAPYPTIMMVALGVFSVLTLVVLIGIF